ncbi:AraC family transcriptional regulator [Achromobacter aloeverae]|uniref:AraC family transcriptional regulator n=1 Tax=Achromobacter aloeverae TaxID=1750518 RepID=A0A4Q1HIP3_9BURK|nr:AraC family transcriptional regulator [Achromobacter aloeverae]RXN87937.1 AraC family transcriptional regulator [Achromobacter aloeverae]
MGSNDLPDAAVSPFDQEAPGRLRDDAARRELAAVLARRTGACVEGVTLTAIPGLHLYRLMCDCGPMHSIQNPILSVIAQGGKRLLVGEDVFEYDPFRYMVSSVDLPVVAEVRPASDAEPYLSLRLDLDVEEIGALIRDDHLPPPGPAEAPRGVHVHPLGGSMLDAVLRLARLLDTPADIPIVAPLIKREILYRLLVNGQGLALRQTALQDSHTQRIARSIHQMRTCYDQPLRVDHMARDAHMSVSSFHHHFKSVTAMSPLQFQKQLRLQEARRLIFMGDGDVAVVARQVGYESPSQFSREYSRLFGTAPMRDKRRWLSESARVAAGHAGHPGQAAATRD